MKVFLFTTVHFFHLQQSYKIDKFQNYKKNVCSKSNDFVVCFVRFWRSPHKPAMWKRGIGIFWTGSQTARRWVRQIWKSKTFKKILFGWKMLIFTDGFVNLLFVSNVQFRAEVGSKSKTYQRAVEQWPRGRQRWHHEYFITNKNISKSK